MKRLFVILLSSGLLFIYSAENLAVDKAVRPHPSGVPERGYAVASWYGKPFHGRYMASGVRFNMHNPHIVAHKTLPLGTPVRITNPENGRSIFVWVMDRGPYVKGRAFDLSHAAAKKLGIVGLGVARIHFEITSPRG